MGNYPAIAQAVVADATAAEPGEVAHDQIVRDFIIRRTITDVDSACSVYAAILDNIIIVNLDMRIRQSWSIGFPDVDGTAIRSLVRANIIVANLQIIGTGIDIDAAAGHRSGNGQAVDNSLYLGTKHFRIGNHHNPRPLNGGYIHAGRNIFIIRQCLHLVGPCCDPFGRNRIGINYRTFRTAALQDHRLPDDRIFKIIPRLDDNQVTGIRCIDSILNRSSWITIWFHMNSIGAGIHMESYPQLGGHVIIAAFDHQLAGRYCAEINRCRDR
ncbi:MAG: hypothetical protein BWY71_02231 [Planctomycetes bacterium ADurb.Bin412]|nr:MAG: hypothetical protein BWY71_02231 [Planctomycetes bacterium ADurb.Bin412]